MQMGLLRVLLVICGCALLGGCGASAPAPDPVAPPEIIARIVDAAKDGDIDALSQLYADGVSVSVRDSEGMSALHHAAGKGELAMCEFLIRKGADIHARDNEAMTPLHHAAEWGHERVCGLLLKKGARINARDRHEGKDSHTPLFLAVMHYQDHLAPLLLEHGADVTIPDNNGYTLLHEIAEHGQEELAAVMLNRGAGIEVRDESGVTPLMTAIDKNRTSMAKLLVSKGANVNAADDDGVTPLLLAAGAGQEETVSLLLDRGAKPTLYWGGTLLHKAARHEGVLAVLLKRLTIDINAMNANGYTVLDKAQSYKETAASKLLIKHRAKTGRQLRYEKYVRPKLSGGPVPQIADPPVDAKDEAKMLKEVRDHLAGGGDVNALDSPRSRFTRLHIAARYGYVKVAGVLLDKGADINSEGNSCGALTPLHVAGSLKIAGLLAAKGARIDARNTEGQLPIHTVAEFGAASVVQWLIGKGQDPNVPDNHLFTPLHSASTSDVARVLILAGADVNARSVNIPKYHRGGGVSFSSHPHNASPLHMAAEAGRADVVRVLLDYGAPINARGDNGRTPLGRAREEIRRCSERLKEIRAETQPSDNLTTYYKNRKEKLQEVVQVLIKAGAAPGKETDDGA